MQKKLCFVSWLLMLSIFSSAAAQAANEPMFYAYTNAVQTIPASTFEKVIFHAVEFNYGETFDLANSKWAPGQVGVGYISAAVFWTGIPSLLSGQAIEIHIFKNGNDYRRMIGAAAGHGGQSSQIGAYVTVDSITDYFEIYVFQNGDGSKNINDHWTSVCWFSGRMFPALYEPVFYAYKNTIQTIPASTCAKVTFDAAEFNSGGTFDLENSKWAPGQVGVGYISAAVFWTGDLGSGQAIEIHIFKNGNDYKSIPAAASGPGGQSSQIGAYVAVDNITDYFEIYVFQNGAAGENINGGRTSVSWFSGYMISAGVCGDADHPILDADVNADCKVDLLDIAEVAKEWLACTHPDCD